MLIRLGMLNAKVSEPKVDTALCITKLPTCHCNFRKHFNTLNI